MGCDIPTELPTWETEWTLPAEGLSISVADLLPDGVSVLSDRSAFALEPVAVDVEWRLRDHCEACVLVHGLRVPKPPFTVNRTLSLSLPPAILEIEVVSGWIELRILHGLGFDPIRPGGGAYGLLALELDDAAGEPFLAMRRSGEGAGLPSGVAHIDSLPLAAATLAGAVPGRFRLDSPLGDPARIDADAVFSASTILRDLLVERIRVRPGSRTFALDETLPVGEVSEDLLERVTGGAITLQVDNGFGAAFLLQLTVTSGDGASFERALRVPEGANGLEVPFSGSEIRSLVSADAIRIRGTGRAEGGAAEVELRPDQGLELESAVMLRVRTGKGS